MKSLTVLSTILSTIILSSCSTESNFSSAVIDCGIVVTDINRSKSFYESIGFQEVGRFDVPKKVSGDSGLTDYSNLSVTVMALSDGDEGTKVKLMESKFARTAANSYIDSTAGISYLTVFVKDAGMTLEMLKGKGIQVLKKGPVDLSPLGFEPHYLLVIKDPDGNFIEFVGPITAE